MISAIYAYDNRSESAKSLAKALSIKLIRHVNSRYVPRQHKTVINWGCAAEAIPIPITQCPMLNKVGSRNKIEQLEIMSGPARTPEWATRREDGPIKWLNDGYDVVVRHCIRGHTGKGIQIVHPDEHLPLAPLYTKYVKKKREFRVHCFHYETYDPWQGTTSFIDYSVDEKKGKYGADRNYQIRNHANGFIYKRDAEDVPADVVDQAVAAFRATGLHFGAVDVIYNEAQDKAYVLECNTSPGLYGHTLELYTEYFNELEKNNAM